MRNQTILLIGGDQRQKELFYILKQNFNNVFSLGLFEKEDRIQKADIVILPFPAIKNEYINSPFYNNKIKLNDVYEFLKPNSKIFAGNIPKDCFNEYYVFDYSKDEMLVYYNAALTAESAIAIAISNSKFSLINSEILITGFGRISKHLALILRAFNCNITIAARKEQDIAFINSLGFKAIKIYEIKDYINRFDFVFNTVPATIFSEEELNNANHKTIFIDLASKPGGFIENNKNIISALALPGKFSPISAGNIIFETIRPYFNKEEKT